jgi:hypothetical protein
MKILPWWQGCWRSSGRGSRARSARSPPCGRARLSRAWYPSTPSGRGTTRAQDAQGTPTQSQISPSVLVYENYCDPRFEFPFPRTLISAFLARLSTRTRDTPWSAGGLDPREWIEGKVGTVPAMWEGEAFSRLVPTHTFWDSEFLWR